MGVKKIVEEIQSKERVDTFEIYETVEASKEDGTKVQVINERNKTRMTLEQVTARITNLQSELDRWTAIKTDIEALE